MDEQLLLASSEGYPSEYLQHERLTSARINLENNAMFTMCQEGRAVRIECDLEIAAINRWGSADQDGHQVACRDNIHWYSCDDR